jgi:hypothetical protein
MWGSLRTIASELAALEPIAPSGQLYHASSVRHMLARQALRPILVPSRARGQLIRASSLLTVVMCQAPPRTVGMPRFVSSSLVALPLRPAA